MISKLLLKSSIFIASNFLLSKLVLSQTYSINKIVDIGNNINSNYGYIDDNSNLNQFYINSNDLNGYNVNYMDPSNYLSTFTVQEMIINQGSDENYNNNAENEDTLINQDDSGRIRRRIGSSEDHLMRSYPFQYGQNIDLGISTIPQFPRDNDAIRSEFARTRGYSTRLFDPSTIGAQSIPYQAEPIRSEVEPLQVLGSIESRQQLLQQQQQQQNETTSFETTPQQQQQQQIPQSQQQAQTTVEQTQNPMLMTNQTISTIISTTPMNEQQQQQIQQQMREQMPRSREGMMQQHSNNEN